MHLLQVDFSCSQSGVEQTNALCRSAGAGRLAHLNSDWTLVLCCAGWVLCSQTTLHRFLESATHKCSRSCIVNCRGRDYVPAWQAWEQAILMLAWRARCHILVYSGPAHVFSFVFSTIIALLRDSLSDQSKPSILVTATRLRRMLHIALYTIGNLHHIADTVSLSNTPTRNRSLSYVDYSTLSDRLV